MTGSRFPLPPWTSTAGGILIDGPPPGCVCNKDCGFPCWQRVGLTTIPCCVACPPLDDEPDELKRAA
jgi:hypothetical protein